jgi:hypothetical protein
MSNMIDITSVDLTNIFGSENWSADEIADLVTDLDGEAIVEWESGSMGHIKVNISGRWLPIGWYGQNVFWADKMFENFTYTKNERSFLKEVGITKYLVARY